MTATVTALLVSHDGARWLPAVLDGLAAQSRTPDRVVAVDTGSVDASVALLAQRLGPAAVHAMPVRTSYGEAVRAGLAAGTEGRPAPSAATHDPVDEWVWLLHDDSNPDPAALEQLLRAAEADPSVDILGPKLREWPSLRRLLEVGVTLSGTGRRETGLEHGEYDQGQHDETREVLAVNTAGMLVRRSVLERLGFDPRLPVFGNDVDLGWRAARAGHRTVVVPRAVVFHVEAAHRGVRATPLTGPHVRRGERAAALYTLLANGPAWRLPFLLVRLLLGSLLRALGFLVVRSPGEALDELVAVVSVYARPWRIVAGRSRRRVSATVPHRDVRHLLAPVWLPYRHGLDFVGDLLTAVSHQATDMSTARRARGAAPETGPVPGEAQSLPPDTGLVARLLSSPVAGVLAVLVVAALVAARGLVGSGVLAGGALLPAPGSAAHWWHTYLASGHGLGTGSSAPAAPWLLPLALMGSVLLGKAWLVVDLVFLLAVPLCAYGGYRFLREVTGALPAALWGGVAYGLLPVLTGAVQQGRLGTVVATLVLPWLAHAARFLSLRYGADRRRRAAWRTGIWLAVLAAFAPLGLLLATVLTVVLLMAGLITDAKRWARPSAWLPVLVPVAVGFVLLVPWSVLVWSHQGAAAWLFEAGLPVPRLTDPRTALEVAFGRPAEQGAPWWLGVGVVLAALGALLRGDTRRQLLVAWCVVVVALGAAAVLSHVTASPASSAVPQSLWLGLPLVLAQAAAITAAAVAGAGVRARLAGKSFGWRQPVGAAVVILALVTPVAGLLWWLADGSGDPLDREPPARVPAYMVDAVAADPAQGILVVRGDRVHGFEHLLLRGPGLRLGDVSVLPPVEDQRPLSALVADLASAPEPGDVERLASFGVGYVYAPAPVDGLLAGNLDTLSGVTTASAPGRARAWQLRTTAAPAALDVPVSDARPWLLALQAVAFVVAVVQAAPTRRAAR